MSAPAGLFKPLYRDGWDDDVSQSRTDDIIAVWDAFIRYCVEEHGRKPKVIPLTRYQLRMLQINRPGMVNVMQYDGVKLFVLKSEQSSAATE